MYNLHGIHSFSRILDNSLSIHMKNIIIVVAFSAKGRHKIVMS